MRTHKLSLLALAAIAALATSCTGDELAGNDTPQEGIVIKATAGTPQGGADTRLAHTDGSTEMSIVWAAGDKFTAYASTGNKTDYEIQAADAGKSSASFTGVWNSTPSAGTIHALYPVNATTDPTAITLSLEGQAGTLDGLKGFNYMTASTAYTDGDLNFGAFAHQVAIVKLVLTFPADVTATEATEVGLKATGLNKSAVLNLTTGEFISGTPGDVTTGTTTVAITSKKLTAYLCVFGGALTNAKAVAKVGSDNYAANLTDLTIEAGKMYTATVELSKQTITWATGNLVAKADGSGCEIGAATDKGLFFQFGSLIGWSTEDPLAIAVSPVGCDVTAWNGSWTGDPATENTVTGTGDPCKYYLKGTWRLPTKDEYAALFKNGGYPSGTWKWENSSATNTTSGLTFPASGYRRSNDAALGSASGYYWSASPRTNTSGHNLYFDDSNVYSNNDNRAYGLPVRCVQEK